MFVIWTNWICFTSQTDWSFQGGLPPLNEEDWKQEFEKYKQFPEFKRNPNREDFSLRDFKKIYLFEYTHRMYGRFIGLAFSVPLVYFVATGRIGLSSPLMRNLGLLFALGGTQGLIGWWMVKSGLKDEGNQTWNNLPKVSPYRLATHLGMAFTIFVLLLYNGLHVYASRKQVTNIINELGVARVNVPDSFRYSLYGMLGFAFSTAMMGAFVAGNEANVTFNANININANTSNKQKQH
ncbi:cytochrome c oxidase assembly protein cox15 [Reticulomyxa filosa]|uniref:Cytochrome c oxidase assembly protein cox15 n=1 Tax=Reticulomyxa filosa TaxID=46433 RepID=X6NPW1_RETFI|nr:cytochrome c oxidase assembly protein cox15 [Reticulomyxa filosa]|eukprot:ETO27953.1 cytochrome c oxidase assembly protein cox15 [Reticulomyxa filosa]